MLKISNQALQSINSSYVQVLGLLQLSGVLLAMIALLAAQSSTQTFIHDVFLFLDTCGNAWYNQIHCLIGRPYLSVIASNVSQCYLPHNWSHLSFWFLVLYFTPTEKDMSYLWARSDSHKTAQPRNTHSCSGRKFLKVNHIAVNLQSPDIKRGKNWAQWKNSFHDAIRRPFSLRPIACFSASPGGEERVPVW